MRLKLIIAECYTYVINYGGIAIEQTNKEFEQIENENTELNSINI